VKLNGLDIYDPTTGEIRSSSTDGFTCWFLDTNYSDSDNDSANDGWVTDLSETSAG
jgi:hypothetical protein